MTTLRKIRRYIKIQNNVRIKDKARIVERVSTYRKTSLRYHITVTAASTVGEF